MMLGCTPKGQRDGGGGGELTFSLQHHLSSGAMAEIQEKDGSHSKHISL